jgi:excisionase family DNA binding protein
MTLRVDIDTRLLTAEEVADWLQVKIGWVYAESRAGRMPHVRLGRYFRYRQSAIVEWLTRLERISEGPGPLLDGVRREAVRGT